KSSHLQTVLEQSGYNRIDLVLQQHEVPHHNVVAAVALGHRQPSSETKWRGRGDSVDGDLHIVSRNVDFENLPFVIALLIDSSHDGLIIGLYFLCMGHRRSG